ncbi:putative malate dehydrogenase 1B isoform X2 [Hyla sarda]|uniref:putative malate dehydrogenase 1B isoform X2 n=1 Tax=Hyla sarda TaxID=327740 RepID=UPI0024C3695A|nr:putative malate dehydrogenase 1B isoform X2 [Hyla sarda]XP_056389601.1 putative malate dehydrogenase 1B isoform X2 [Hyla sarda]
MAKFVLAGRADCPYYAKAELLANYLQKNLPNFRIHRITQHPDDWEKWLADICMKNGWKHNHSPIIWRELLDRGSKGLLLGGFNDFMEHAQEYYSVTSAMLSEIMKDIAAENMQAHLDLEEEKETISQQFNPLNIWIIGASMPACYHLIPMLASGKVFGMNEDIWLHLLDHDHSQDTLQGLKMEAEDLAYPCLRKVTLHTITDDVFLQADFVIVLNDIRANEDQSSEAHISKIKDQYAQYGTLIDQNAKKEVKVMVSGSTYVNLIALVIIKNAPSINSHNIVALPTQLEFEAKAQIANKLKINSSVIKDVIVWGNISGINHLDLHLAKVYRYDSSIWGPSTFSRPLLPLIHDRKWLKNDIITEWKKRKEHRSGLSAAHSIAIALSCWKQDSDNGGIVSLGVLSEGFFNLPFDIVYSMPVTFQNGEWQVCAQVAIQDHVKETLLRAADELLKEKSIAFGISQEEKIVSEEL